MAGTRWSWMADVGTILVLTLFFHAARGSTPARTRDGVIRHALWVEELSWATLAWGLLRGWRAIAPALTRTRPDSPPLRRVAVFLVVAIGQAMIALPAGLALLQMHPPRLKSDLTPEKLGLKAERFTVTTPDGYRLAGFHVPAGRADRPAVLIAHGLGASKEDFLVAVRMAARWDVHVAIVDFRGHGESEGPCCTLGIKESRDIRAARAWLAAKHPGQPILGLGYSMGGAALLRAAAEEGGFDRLVIDSTFSSAERLGRDGVLGGTGPLRYPLWWMGRLWGRCYGGVDLADAARVKDVERIKVPILFVHGTADRTIPAEESRILAAAAGGRGGLQLLEGADHMQTIQFRGYSDLLRNFFQIP